MSARALLTLRRLAQAPRPRRCTHHDDLPHSIDRFAIRGLLGRGGQGVVLRAWDPHAGSEVALKVPTTARPLDHGSFLHEALLTNVLRSPYLPRVHDFGYWRGRPWLAMELLEGATLKTLSRRSNTSPTVALLCDWLQQACAGVRRIHAAGFIHGDLKPSNLHISGNDLSLRILDLGIARRSGRPPQPPNQVMATPRYAAPEVLAGAAGRAASDVYSLGVTFGGLAPRGRHCLKEIARWMTNPHPVLRPGLSEVMGAL